MLTCSNWSAGWNRVPVIHDWDVQVRPSEIVTILGTNGVGKSTFMKSLVGAVPIASGTLEVDGPISYVPEGRGILSRLTVRENLILGYRGRRADRRGRIDEVLALFPALSALLARKAGFLSGGEQQMLAIGRGLMSQPSYLLLDEPTLGLAPIMLEHIVASLHSMRSSLSVLIAEQNLPFSLAVSDRLYVVGDGGLQETNTGDPSFREVVTTAYLGGE
jgi:branched-chain amino acid transport system ATP-binding protein